MYTKIFNYYNQLLQNTGLESTTLQEAPPEDAPQTNQYTSPTQAYKLQKEQLQRLPLQPFEQPPIPTLTDDLNSELLLQPYDTSEKLQVSSNTPTQSKPHRQNLSSRKQLTDNETENPTPQLRSRRTRPINVKRYSDMIYY